MDIDVRRHYGRFGPLSVQALTAFQPRKAPLIRSDRKPFGISVTAAGEGVIARIHGMRGVADRGGFSAQRKRSGPGSGGDVLAAYQAGDGLIAVPGHGYVEHQATVAGQQVTFPGSPHQSVTTAHEKTISRMGQGSRIVRRRRVVEELQLALVTAIPIAEEQPAVPLSHVQGFQNAEIGGKFHQASNVQRRLVDIDDA